MKKVYKLFGLAFLALLFSSCGKAKSIEEYDKAFINSNFANCSVTYSLTGEGIEGFDSYTRNYKYDDGKIEVNKEIKDESGNTKTITYYSYNKDNVDYLVFKQNSDNEAFIKDHCKARELDQYFYITPDYKYFNIFFNEFGFKNIRLEKFNKDVVKVENNRFVVDSAKVANLGKYAIGDNDRVTSGDDEKGHYVSDIREKFEEISFEVEKEYISKIIFRAKVSDARAYDGEEEETKECNYTYEISFSDYGKENVVIPEAKEYVFDVEAKDLYDAADGEIIRMNEVYVNDINTIERVVYICDATAALPVNVGDDVVLPKRGDTVSFQAYVRCYGDLVELDAIDFEICDVEPTSMINYGINSFDGLDNTFTGEMIEMDYLTVITKDIDNLNLVFNTWDDTAVRLEFTEAEIDIVNDLFKDITVNMGVFLKTVAVSMNKTTNDFTLRLLDSTEVEPCNGMVCVNDSIEVLLNTELEEILSRIEVLNFVDGNRELLFGQDLECETSYDGTTIGTELIKVTAGQNEIYIPVRTLYDGEIESFIEENGKGINYIKNRYNATTGLPSTGDVDILVIPLGFTNQEIASNYKTILEKAFNGTSEDTGWESLKSYYYKSSFGKLNFNAQILDVYQTNDPYYTRTRTVDGRTYPDDYLGDYYSLDNRYINEALAYYDDQIDYSKYDANNDGAIDCVYFIYLAPYNYSGLDFSWAYTTQYIGEEKIYDELRLDYYLWMSYDFFFENSRPMAINCETVIHETGHALGLDDYYDTLGATGGYGGGTMMAMNVGDHEAYSKAILGWINPYIVINKDTTIALNPYETSGEAIFIAKDYDGVYFNEYYIIDYYTPTGLNEIASGSDGLPSIAGVRIIKVNAKVKETIVENQGAWEVTEASNSDPENRLIYVYEADGNHIINGDFMTNKDLFQAGRNVINLTWADGTECNFIITIQSIEDGKATIVIDFE